MDLADGFSIHMSAQRWHNDRDRFAGNGRALAEAKNAPGMRSPNGHTALQSLDGLPAVFLNKWHSSGYACTCIVFGFDRYGGVTPKPCTRRRTTDY